MGRCPPDTPVFGWGGKALPDTCNGKHIQFIRIECNLMLRVINEASVMTCSSHDSRDMSSIRLSPFPLHGKLENMKNDEKWNEKQ